LDQSSADADALTLATGQFVGTFVGHVVEADSLQETAAVADLRSVRLLIAGQVGPVRLIDNSAATDAADHDPAAPVTRRVRQLERIG
jgi:hypothetical protein